MAAINDCMEWKGLKNNKGYGTKRIRRYGGIMLTHRLAYAWANDMWGEDGPEIPAEMKIMHTCDNPSCFNPSHLVMGTQKDNMRDCSDKGRFFNQKKTHCKRGHKFSPENTYITPSGSRECKACRRYRYSRRSN